MAEEPEQYCSKCNRKQPLTDFVPRGGKRSGYITTCKACRRDYQRQVTRDAQRWRALRKLVRNYFLGPGDEMEATKAAILSLVQGTENPDE